LVEFALLLPLLLVIVFGIIQFGIIYNTHLVITSAAREGARMATVTDSGADVETAIKRAVASLNANVSGPDIRAKDNTMPGADNIIWWYIDYPEISKTTGHPVSVYVKGRVNINVPIINNLIGNSVKIPAHATMRIEHS
jgi:Flp pilus assembly protein TadG